MNKRTYISIFLLAILLSLALPVRAQDEYLKHAIDSCLRQGNCSCARNLYEAYKEVFGTNQSFENRIAICESEHSKKEESVVKPKSTSIVWERIQSYFSEDLGSEKFVIFHLGLPIHTDVIANPVSFGVTIGGGERLSWYGTLAMGSKFHGIPEKDANFHFSGGPAFRVTENIMVLGGIGYAVCINSYLPSGFIYEVGIATGIVDSFLMSMSYEGISGFGIQTGTVKVGMGWKM